MKRLIAISIAAAAMVAPAGAGAATDPCEGPGAVPGATCPTQQIAVGSPAEVMPLEGDSTTGPSIVQGHPSTRSAAKAKRHRNHRRR